MTTNSRGSYSIADGYGGPERCIVERTLTAYCNGDHAVFDTHEAGWLTLFEGVAVGGCHGVQNRARKTQIRGEYRGQPSNVVLALEYSSAVFDRATVYDLERPRVAGLVSATGEVQIGNITYDRSEIPSAARTFDGIGMSFRAPDRIIVPAAPLAHIKDTAPGARTLAEDWIPVIQFNDADLATVGAQVVIPPEWRTLNVYVHLYSANTGQARTTVRFAEQNVSGTTVFASGYEQNVAMVGATLKQQNGYVRLPAPSRAAGETITVYFSRNGAHTSDTLVGDLGLTAIEIERYD